MTTACGDFEDVLTTTMSEERLWRWYHLGEEKEEDQAEMDGLCQPRHESLSGQQKMNAMTELAGGELCLLQQPHNQVGAARRR